MPRARRWIPSRRRFPRSLGYCIFNRTKSDFWLSYDRIQTLIIIFTLLCSLGIVDFLFAWSLDSESSWLYIKGLTERGVRYRSDCISPGLPSLEPQTIPYTLPPSSLVFRNTPLFPVRKEGGRYSAVAYRGTTPAFAWKVKGTTVNLHQGSWPQGSNPGPFEWAS